MKNLLKTYRSIRESTIFGILFLSNFLNLYSLNKSKDLKIHFNTQHDSLQILISVIDIYRYHNLLFMHIYIRFFFGRKRQKFKQLCVLGCCCYNNCR